MIAPTSRFVGLGHNADDILRFDQGVEGRKREGGGSHEDDFRHTRILAWTRVAVETSRLVESRNFGNVIAYWLMSRIRSL